MKDLFYTELREKVREMEQTKREQEEAERVKCDRDFLCVLDIMPKLSSIGKKEGLLALELAVESFDYVPCAMYLTEMILLVVMGFDSDFIENISLTRYFSGDLKGREGLIYLMYLIGILSIWEGEDSYILEQKLKAMVPWDVADAYEKEQERKDADKESKEQDEDLDLSQVEGLCKEEFTWDEQDPGYFVMKLADYIFVNLTDRAMQYLFMKIDDRDLRFALKGLSGAARRHVFTNCSKKHAILLAVEMNDMGHVREADIVWAVQRILKLFFELLSDQFYEKTFTYSTLYESWESFFDYFAVPKGEYGLWKPDFEKCRSVWEGFIYLQSKAL